MQLKKLEAYGFKSFADKIEVEFDKGITAIVGPNGSGKSNISDAVKWVLGEQNVRNLRGVKAEDIIFTGSETRRQMGVAEVSLYFDNDGSLPVDFNEVVVTRRLFRTGESEFYINKSRCRLKDITNLFADSGIGHDSMGIISQNKMDEILNARPEEKRLFFEEAAGITKYRNRKKEAMRKLDDTEGNLQRVYDILGEIENQLEPLRISAEKAARHQELQAELKRFQLAELYHRYQELQGRRQRFDSAAQEKKDQELAASTAVQLIEGRTAKLDAEILALEKQMEALAAKRNEIHGRIEAADSEIRVLEERRRQGKANRQRHQQLLKELAATAEEARQNVEFLEKSEAQAQAKKLEAENAVLANRQQAKALREQLMSMKGRRDELARRQQAADRNIHTTASRVQVLERLQSSYEGFGRAVRAVLKSQRPWRRGVCGAVAELLQVPGRYVTAIEVALGGSQQNLVTEDTDTAKSAIEMLKRDRLGRATFLPLSSITVRLNRENVPAGAGGVLGWANELVGTEPKYSRVADFLLGRTLVVDTLDNALALNRQLGQRLRIVTLEGELLSPGGALAGGSQQNRESSFLNRREEIRKLQEALSGFEQEKQGLSAELQQMAEKYDALDREADELSAATNKLEMEKAVLEQQAIRAREQILLRQRELKRCEDSSRQQNDELAALEKELSDSMASIGELMEASQLENRRFVAADEEHRAVYKQRMNRLSDKKNNEKEVREAHGRLTDIQNQLHQIELDASKIDYDIEQCQQEMLSSYGLVPERAAEEAPELEPAELKRKLRGLDNELNALGAVNPNAPQEYADLQQRHGFLSGNAEDLEKAKADLMQLIGEMEATMTRQFREAFVKINEFFGEIFVQLFGGGQAKILLTDKENVLESGVNIMVTVPGKKTQNLSVLSGGERALTVVALLFSFLKYRPAPFSVLDEIDAPLDEANIGRFGTFLQEYAEHTQFIIVTHRKGTMEAADTMYGVTIEDAGVSKVLSVKLQDYEE
ncbi:AAA family ATPase [Anaerovibrio sp.]|uniref:AAA family ATPase n=1 Tax=Anaerovibrio sp. TaxID=1872532 RepID=UPI003F183CD5